MSMRWPIAMPTGQACLHPLPGQASHAVRSAPLVASADVRFMFLEHLRVCPIVSAQSITMADSRLFVYGRGQDRHDW